MSKNHNAFSRLADLLTSAQRSALRQMLLIKQLTVCALYLASYHSDARARRFCSPIVLWSTPDQEQCSAVKSVMRYLAIAQQLQSEGNLGQRMSEALTRQPPSPDQRPEARLVLGIDAPALDTALIDRCVRMLRRKPWVFVPTVDGGFVVCARLYRHQDRAHQQTPTSVEVALNLSDWGHDQVMSLIAQRLRSDEIGRTSPIADLDHPDDYRQAVSDGSLPRALYSAVCVLNAADHATSVNHLFRQLSRDGLRRPNDDDDWRKSFAQQLQQLAVQRGALAERIEQLVN